MVMTKATLGPDTVDRIWHHFRKGDGLDYTTTPSHRARSLAFANRSEQLAFGNWVWSQGGSLRRDNKKYYIDFREPDRASFFVLKYL